MSFRKAKDDKPTPEGQPEVQQAQQQIDAAAQDVTKAAEKFGGVPLNRFMSKDDLRMTMREVDSMDDMFRKQEKAMTENLDVRVLKVDPSGRMTDVTNRVRPEDIPHNLIKDFRAEPGVEIPRNADGSLNREEALSMLTSLLGGGRSRKEQVYAEATSQRQIRAMEAAISEADKLLEHWKK